MTIDRRALLKAGGLTALVRSAGLLAAGTIWRTASRPESHAPSSAHPTQTRSADQLRAIIGCE